MSSYICFLENERNKADALKKAIQASLNSPRVENFDFDENLKKLNLVNKTRAKNKD